MDARPVLKSKITVPQLAPGVLVTDRIKALGIARARVVSVVAPAGYGKTTAVLASLRGCTGLHWYRLETEDARPPIFYAHLLECLFGRAKKREPESLQLFRSLSDPGRGSDLLNATICQDAWTLYGEGRKERYIVFDDFQHVLENARMIQTMRYFITNMPPNLHIIVVSRKDTGIFDGAQGLREDVRFVTEKELGFGEDEIDLYMKQRGLLLPPGVAAGVHRATEGWISGVVMLGSMAGRFGAETLEAYLKTAGQKAEISRYFQAEALRGFPAEIIRSVSLMATLDEFRVEDLESVFGISGARGIVDYCEKTNFFLQKTVSGEATYRFHAMFRRFLLDIRDECFSETELMAFHVRASGYYLAKDDCVRAVRHLMLAGRAGDAVRLLCLHGKKMLGAGQGEHLKMLIEELPEQAAENNPYLSFYYGYTIVSTEFERSRACLERAARLFEEQGNTDMQVQVLGVLFTAFAQRNDVANIRKLVARCERLDEKIKSSDARGTLLACRLGRAAFDEDFAEGLALSEELGNCTLSDIWLYGVNNFRCMIYYRLGDLESGKRIIEENLKMPLVQKNDQWKILNMVFCQNIAFYLGDDDWSAWVRNELIRLGEKYGSGYALGFGKKDAAFASYITHDIDRAVELINASAAHFRAYRNDAHVRRSVLYKNLWLLEKNPALVNPDEVLEACDYLVREPVGQGFAETAQSYAGVILRELGDYGRAEQLLLASFETSGKKQARQTMAGTAMHLAKLYYDLGDHARGDAYLKTFITLSFAGRYITYYDLFLPTLVEAAAYCVVKNMHGDYAAGLISRYYGKQAAQYLVRHAAELCSAKGAKLFISRFGEPKSRGKTVRITLLGDFAVAIGDSQIKDSEWKTRKISGILKYLLLHRDQFVHKEPLAELFWPDTDGKAAMASMNVAMYELRRVLSAHGLAFEDEFTLIHDRGNGYEIVSSDWLEIDTDRLVRLFDAYRLYDLSGGDVRTVLAEIVGAYAGELLPKDIYEEWTFLERERYKSMFSRAAARLCAIYLDESAFDEAEALLARVLSADPYDEAASAMLADIYKKTGRESSARGIERAFARRLKE